MSLLPPALSPTPGAGSKGRTTGPTYLDPVHTSLHLLQLHADLTVPDVAEVGRGREGGEEGQVSHPGRSETHPELPDPDTTFL